MNNYNLTSNIIFTTTLFGEETSFNIQSVNLPGLTIAYSNMPSRSDNLKPVVAFESVDFQPLLMTFLADEKMQIWKEIITFILKGRDEDFFNHHHDGVLLIKGNNGQSIMKIFYRNIIITQISDIEYNTTDSNTEQVFSVEIQYDYFDVEDSITTRNVIIEVDDMKTEIEEALSRREGII